MIQYNREILSLYATPSVNGVNNFLSMLSVVDSYIQNCINWEHGLVQQIEASDSVNNIREISLN